MREEWREVRLGDVAFRRTDFTPVFADQLYRVVGVQRSGWGLVDRDPMRGDSMKFDKLMELHADDLVYRTITAFEAPSTVVTSEFEGAFVTPQTFPVYSLDRSTLLPGYMALLTTSPAFHEDMSSRCVGTVLRRKTLSKGAFESIPISLPPLIEQRRIVDLIAAVDDAIEAADGEAEITAEARRALWHGLASKTVRVDRVGAVTQGKSLPKTIQGTVSGDISWFKIADMTSPQNLFGYSEADTRVSHAVLESNGGKITPEGSVTFPRVGAAVATEKKRLLLSDAALDENHIAVTPLEQGIEEVTLAAFESVRLGGLVRSGAVPSLNMGLIRELEIPWPADGVDLHEVDALLGASRSAERTALANAGALRTLRSNLLTVLLSGEHEIPASYDQFLNLDEEAAA
ncbi:restriction endonuclease subunit S [Microbacterium sp. NPDC089321]|uniref:restriction endonuclease subunit S n=1 Tax=Microbacterium sp. NPDC089321 TaxID=3155183 RepID=UPI00341FD5B1